MRSAAADGIRSGQAGSQGLDRLFDLLELSVEHSLVFVVGGRLDLTTEIAGLQFESFDLGDGIGLGVVDSADATFCAIGPT